MLCASLLFCYASSPAPCAFVVSSYALSSNCLQGSELFFRSCSRNSLPSAKQAFFHGLRAQGSAPCVQICLFDLSRFLLKSVLLPFRSRAHFHPALEQGSYYFRRMAPTSLRARKGSS